jgi:glutamate/tyrosine decarboxylase-like PLP-dependent enzyme
MPRLTIPKKGAPREEVIRALKDAKRLDADWKSGKTWSLVYYNGEEYTDFLREAYGTYFSENALSPIAFPSLRRFENEVVAMAAEMLGGDENAAGAMTSGGSESILMAVKTSRDYMMAERPSITNPEIVLPATAHPAFLKAAHYFGLKPVIVPVDRGFRADAKAAEDAMNENTVLVVGSAPAYPHGVIDPIAAMAAAAKKRGICFHTDACLGGFLLPWLKKLGRPIPPFDLGVDGVTSISADIHKYGFAAKGASTVIYKSEDIRKHQYFAYTNWPGGLYASPSMTGTRPGGAIAAAWAALHHVGEDGYLAIAAQVMETTRELIDGIRSVPGLKILGDPEMSVFAFASDEMSVYALGEAMEKRGWHLDRQQLPASLHMMVTPAHKGVSGAFARDLGVSAEEVRGSVSSEVSGEAAIYGMIGTMPDRGAAAPLIVEFLSQTYKLGEEG